MPSPTSSKLTVETPSDTEIVMTRTFNAPIALVFDCFTKAEHMRHWWGFADGEITDCEVDLRVGGKWRIVGKSGTGEFTFFGEYTAIDRPNSYSWTFGYSDGRDFTSEPGPVTTSFEEVDGRTTMTELSTYPSKELRDQMIATGMEEGAVESLDRLEKYLATID